MGIKITQVDAFADQPFQGNSAAVCICPEPATDDWMQLVAREMNLAETAFLFPGDDGFRLRWFTPTVEVDLCGHATLAAAHVLWDEGHLPPDREARFHTKSGLLTAARSGEWIELDFPALSQSKVRVPDGLEEALGSRGDYVGKSRLDLLVEVPSEEILRQLAPDFIALKKLDARGIIVTSRADSEEYDFVSRFFAPALGVDEDPVTGSAHCCLAPYWMGRLGKTKMTGYQASVRGGTVRVEVRGDRVGLGGKAFTVLRGELS